MIDSGLCGRPAPPPTVTQGMETNRGCLDSVSKVEAAGRGSYSQLYHGFPTPFVLARALMCLVRKEGGV